MYVPESHFAAANISIPSTTSFYVKIALTGGFGIGQISGMRNAYHPKQFEARSFALICARSHEKPKTQYREFKFGKRTDGDALLRHEKVQVVPSDRELPRHSIYYQNFRDTLTSVSIKTNVSKKNRIKRANTFEMFFFAVK